MARTFTLTQLIEDVRARTDLQHDTGFVSDAEITRYLNQSITEWYELVVQARGEEYFLLIDTIKTEPGVTDYELPEDFYRLVGVDVEYSGRTISLRPLPFAERAKFLNDKSAPHPSRYHVMGHKTGDLLYLIPAPRSEMHVEVYYIPTAPSLDIAERDEKIDGISGWEEYAVVDTCIKVLQKGDRDVSVLFAQKQQLQRRIETMAQDRHAEPSSIQDVTRCDGWGYYY